MSHVTILYTDREYFRPWKFYLYTAVLRQVGGLRLLSSITPIFTKQNLREYWWLGAPRPLSILIKACVACSCTKNNKYSYLQWCSPSTSKCGTLGAEAISVRTSWELWMYKLNTAWRAVHVSAVIEFQSLITDCWHTPMNVTGYRCWNICRVSEDLTSECRQPLKILVLVGLLRHYFNAYHCTIPLFLSCCSHWIKLSMGAASKLTQLNFTTHDLHNTFIQAKSFWNLMAVSAGWAFQEESRRRGERGVGVEVESCPERKARAYARKFPRSRDNVGIQM
jgi:hypothetical protein